MKALLPMDVTPDGRLVRASEVQPLKALLPMDVTPDGRSWGQRGAAAEGMAADGCHIRHADRHERGALVEGIHADGRHARHADRHERGAPAKVESTRMQIRHADRHERGAAVEGTVADGRHLGMLIDTGAVHS